MKSTAKRVVSLFLTLTLSVSGIVFTPAPETVEAATITTTNDAVVEIQMNSKTAFESTDGDLYNYVKYGVDATSDSNYESGKDASKAVDGSVDSDSNRWSNNNHDSGHWIQVDLRHSYSVSKLGISWEVASSLDYKIEVSNDGTKYEEVTNVTINDYTANDSGSYENRIDSITLSKAVTARYIKITDVGNVYIPNDKNERRYGMSIWEIGIFGSELQASEEYSVNDTSYFTKKDSNTGETLGDIIDYTYYNYVRNNAVTSTASGEDSSSDTPISGAIDNIASTRWSHGGGDSSYYLVDLGNVYSVEKVYLSWEQANSTVYNIFKSEDGTNYSLITTVNAIGVYSPTSEATTGARVDRVTFGAVNARYIKIQAVQRCYKGSDYSGGQYNGMSLFEVGIYGLEQEKPYDMQAFPEFEAGSTQTVGNQLEAEDFINSASGVTKETVGPVNGQNIGGCNSGRWVQYNIYFDRKTSKINLRYSSKDRTGKVQIFLNDSTMSGTPVAEVNISKTGSWETYTDGSAYAEIPAGNYKVYFKFVADEGSGAVCNIDYFSFEYKPEKVAIVHEAEKAHAYVKGSAGFGADAGQSSSIYSNNYAVANMNTWYQHDRSYLTTYVKADYTGNYELSIDYTGPMTTMLQYRVNDISEWNGDVAYNDQAISSIDSNTVNTVTMQIQLKKGINKIDISGAVWKWADGSTTGRTDGNNVDDERLNIDCFKLTFVDNIKNAYAGTYYTSLIGDKIEAEDIDGRDSKGDNTNYNSAGIHLYPATDSNPAYVGHTTKDSFATYNVYFDRDTTKMLFHASAKTGSSDGHVEVWIDDMDRSGSPVATVSFTDIEGFATDEWHNYKDATVELDTPIECGNHQVMLYFVPDKTLYAGNIDYFQFMYTPEEVLYKEDIVNDDGVTDYAKHEAENAHSYTQGAAEYEPPILESNNTFSNGQAVKELNTWSTDDRAYLTTYVNVEHAGTYKLKTAYATANATTTKIEYNINGIEWKSIDAPGTGSWYTVSTVTAEVELNKGINVIEITGARNVAENNVSWEYVNLDYFILERVVSVTMDATYGENLAYAKPVEASGNQTSDSEDLRARSAVDEDDSTRWASELQGENAYLIVDLEGQYEIEKVNLVFEKAYPNDFQILVSKDKVNWTVANTKRGFKDQDVDYMTYETTAGVCLGKARYVKIRCINMAYYEAMSIRELRVYGTPVKAALSNLSIGADVEYSSSDNSSTTSNPKNAVDGKDSTRWAASASDSNPWYQIDLGKVCSIDSVDLKFERAYPKSFRIQISDDGQTWNESYKSVTNWTEPGDASEIQNSRYENLEFGISFHMDNVSTRYIRLYTDEKIRDDEWGLSIYEFEVWGKELDKADYWSNIKSSDYGVYPVSGLQDTEISDGIMDYTLVQNDVIVNNGTYEVVYDPNDRDIFFYVNPRDKYINYSIGDSVCWSGFTSEQTEETKWGADYDSAIASWGGQQQATVKYTLPESEEFDRLINEGNGEYLTTEIGCKIYGTSSDNIFPDGTPYFAIIFTLKVIKSSLSITDTIMQNGCINVKDPEAGASYEWEKSSDGETWDAVSEMRYDLQIISNSGKTVNVANDIGGGLYYRARKVGTDEWSYPYHIPYYNNVQNGGFEYPAMPSTDESGAKFPFNSNGNEQQYPNGFEGMVWKTIGPGYKSRNGVRTGHDIEIVNGRLLKTDKGPSLTSGFSVTLDQMYGDSSHGDQFAELNSENVGALYQDIITSPTATCMWELDHAGRWNKNSMLVVAMSAQDATTYASYIEPEDIVTTVQDNESLVANGDGVDVTFTVSGGKTIQATIWRVESPGEDSTAGVWAHHTGTYTVPTGENNYLTRFFFVSETGGYYGGESDKTVGNLLDNVSFEMRQDYTIEYYVENINGEYDLYSTISGTVYPYDRVSIPEEPKSDGGTLNKYTLTSAKINTSADPDTSNMDYYVDESRLMTVAYGHNKLKLYYNSNTIAITNKIEGLSEIPEGYQIEIVLKKDGAEIAASKKILSYTDFTKVEKNGDEPEGYFTTITYKGIDFGLDDNTNLEVVQKLVPKITDSTSYLKQVRIDGTSYNIDYTDDNNAISKSKEFTYTTEGANQIAFVNVYTTPHKVTVKKNVDRKFIESVSMEDNNEFEFTLVVKKDNEMAAALDCSDTVTILADGTYCFTLKDSESVDFTVLDGYKVVVAEKDYSEQGYSTSWSSLAVSTTLGSNELTISDVNSDITLTCTNKYVYYGDVEVQGFQMNTDASEGGVSEFSPSFRVVSRACKKLQNADGELRNVVAYGTIFTFDAEEDWDYRSNMRLDNATSANSEHIYDDEELNDVFYFETKVGTYSDWTAREPEDPYYNYYALTFVNKKYNYASLKEQMAFRAYAKLDDGTIVYGTKIYSTRIYDIAENLYNNTKLGSKKAHEFLYNNVLNVVKMEENRADICRAMLRALNVPNTSDERYTLINSINKDIADYIYCRNKYVDSYKERQQEGHVFIPKSLTEDETEILLGLLNAVEGNEYNNYTSIFDWSYYETEKYGNSSGMYKGLYKKIPYDWDNSGYNNFTKH